LACLEVSFFHWLICDIFALHAAQHALLQARKRQMSSAGGIRLILKLFFWNVVQVNNHELKLLGIATIPIQLFNSLEGRTANITIELEPVNIRHRLMTTERNG
jgi:hypothetical protein